MFCSRIATFAAVAAETQQQAISVGKIRPPGFSRRVFESQFQNNGFAHPVLRLAAVGFNPE